MTEEQEAMLESIHRAVIGETANGTIITIGLVDRVRRLEKYKVVLAVALFGGAGVGNFLGVKGWPF